MCFKIYGSCVGFLSDEKEKASLEEEEVSLMAMNQHMIVT